MAVAPGTDPSGEDGLPTARTDVEDPRRDAQRAGRSSWVQHLTLPPPLSSSDRSTGTGT